MGRSPPKPTFPTPPHAIPASLVAVELTLNRAQSNALATLGHLFVDGVPFCVTLEDVVRTDPNPATPANEAKVFGKTAIPAGRYPVTVRWSVKFQREMVAVNDVPGFTGILIHSGNDADDTLGCILVGKVIDGPNRIHGGSEIMPKLFYKIHEALEKSEPVWLNILGAQ